MPGRDRRRERSYLVPREPRTWSRPATATATSPTMVMRMSPAAKMPSTAISAPRNVRTMTGALAGKGHLDIGWEVREIRLEMP